MHFQSFADQDLDPRSFEVFAASLDSGELPSRGDHGRIIPGLESQPIQSPIRWRPEPLPTPSRLRFRNLGAALAAATLATQLATALDATPSPRNASYTIEATLDPSTRLIQGKEVVVWRNTAASATAELWFHLYWNGWRNSRSTWLLEDNIRGRSSAGDELGEDHWGYQAIRSVRLLAMTPAAAEPPGPGVSEGPSDSSSRPLDLTGRLRFVAPDDGNPEDRTVAVVDLPAPVPPGASVEVEIEWSAQVPRTFARTGWRGEFFFVAHWFPQLGVFEAEGWNCHQFHAATEFFADFGVYDVRLTLPSRFVTGATGRLTERKDNGDGTATHRFVQEDVHGFAWTASPHLLDLTKTFAEPGLPPVEMRLLLQPEHAAQADRHFAATRAALLHYGRWFGPYPYPGITIVDPAWKSGAGGMEYPTLLTAGSRRFNPEGGGSPEGVTIHEAGHQFWYGIVANNEIEHAWLDEGLNTFSTAKAYEAEFGRRFYVKRYLSPPGRGGAGRGNEGFLPVLFDELPLSREVWGNRMDRYRETPSSDRQSTPTFRYHPASASNISYNKTALWLATLERHLGWNSLQQILSTFFTRWSFRHPRPQDLFAVANEVTGQDLAWFFDQVHGGSQVFDYAIERATSKPVRREGFFGTEAELAYQPAPKRRGEPAGPFRTEVVVERKGDGTFPVHVRLRFEDGSELLRSWDGQERWTLLVEEGPARLEAAEVDPDHVLLLDVDRTNNSRLREGKAALPAYGWASRWTVWLQDLLLTWAFFI